MTKEALIMAFNRPEKLHRALKALAATNIENIYVSIDGPRKDSLDSIGIEECHKALNTFGSRFGSIEVRQNERNLGCKDACIGALDWFFEKTNFGIVVEDDVLISQSFVDFASWASKEYKDREDIWFINGWSPFHRGEIPELPWLGRIPLFWGWATWSSRWSEARRSFMEMGSENPSQLLTNKYLPTSNEFDDYWKHCFSRMKNGYDTWDYPIVYRMWKMGGMVINPPIRLTQNIGFDNLATHTRLPSGRNSSDMDPFGMDVRKFAYLLTDPCLVVRSERLQFGYQIKVETKKAMVASRLMFYILDLMDKTTYSSRRIGFHSYLSLRATAGLNKLRYIRSRIIQKFRNVLG